MFTTDSCVGWYTTYYTDLDCTDVYNVATVEDFATCRSAAELHISNMLSVRGKCSFAPEPPVSTTSFVVRYGDMLPLINLTRISYFLFYRLFIMSLYLIFSDYVGRQNCSQNELKKFTAYGMDTCFGNGNFSSTLFSGNASTSKHTSVYIDCYVQYLYCNQS